MNYHIHITQKFPLVDDRILSSWGIRFTIANNYLAFYRISEAEKQITVVRFLYAKSNWASILKTGFPLQ